MHSVEHYNMLRNLTVYKYRLVWSEKLYQEDVMGWHLLVREKNKKYTQYFYGKMSLKLVTKVIQKEMSG